MSISFICTVYNEATEILPLLQSLQHQTKRPSEIVIVDSQSTDDTIQTISNFKSKVPIKIIIKKCTRGAGRNLAIKQARGEAIIVSDAGCIAHLDWVEKLTLPIINHKADVVAGFYHMHQPTKLSYYTAPYLGTMSHNINKHTFLPSSRSLAFTKSAWKKVGGYPESYQYAAEDLVFAQMLKDTKKIKWMVAPKAVVDWTPAHTWRKFFHDISNHTRGNLESGYTRHLKKNRQVAIRYAIGIQLLFASVISLNPFLLATSCFLLTAYLIYPSYKFRHLIRHPFDIIMFGLTQFVADIAVLTGLFTPLNRSTNH